jgi:hypothetical protein
VCQSEVYPLGREFIAVRKVPSLILGGQQFYDVLCQRECSFEIIALVKLLLFYFVMHCESK